MSKPGSGLNIAMTNSIMKNNIDYFIHKIEDFDENFETFKKTCSDNGKVVMDIRNNLQKLSLENLQKFNEALRDCRDILSYIEDFLIKSDFILYKSGKKLKQKLSNIENDKLIEEIDFIKTTEPTLSQILLEIFDLHNKIIN